jgi:hypothetical protein
VQWLREAQQIALAVAKPRGAFAFAALTRVVARDLGDTIGGTQPGQVDLLEHHAAALELGHDRVEIIDLNRHCVNVPGAVPAEP